MTGITNEVIDVLGIVYIIIGLTDLEKYTELIDRKAVLEKDISTIITQIRNLDALNVEYKEFLSEVEVGKDAINSKLKGIGVELELTAEIGPSDMQQKLDKVKETKRSSYGEKKVGDELS